MKAKKFYNVNHSLSTLAILHPSFVIRRQQKMFEKEDSRLIHVRVCILLRVASISCILFILKWLFRFTIWNNATFSLIECNAFKKFGLWV